ncbi:ferritin-like domain-containing protein [Actinoallomurus rhizosphaericola]|uniref:ferritin-like domain-containing protein n=1 Tax=Actinoallomurus rhizosphaericola TaxID=2952536 RepID=UPI002091CAE7|nr:ferritin-like domain-containing protein [Actinoallomurus rhizosphaericola]MCO5992309.1 ferritin-like domain-containing protein [Actinoallomurus rhizosphaericola]
MAAQETVAALQAALAAEHVAVFGYGVLGGHVAPAQQQNAKLIWNAHRSRRDRLRGYIQAAGASPVAAAAAYRLPFKVTSASSAARLAATLEDGVIAGYAVLAGASDANLRRYAAQAMQEAAVRAVRWRGAPPPEAFPGLPAGALAPKPEG